MDKWSAKGFTIYDKGTGLRVALVDNKGYIQGAAEINTRLIAAAPEMYELLMEVADELGAVGLPTLSNECYELLARIDGKQEEQK